ncbi:hypothetical protein DH26_gp051 [Chloriridovirus anopheles1]|uniref:Uncharacterized protein n=1 Tax=Chloriridovirus anopheles1 TaxID=1465751 RepID=W8R9L8_9VIRU|nr:hypothetical protein DH26_gp051 [Anopheles minimus iridovirus]AHL67546.1 hypothetical protein AMIV_051 [Anopheles minimus iridovirus]
MIEAIIIVLACLLFYQYIDTGTERPSATAYHQMLEMYRSKPLFKKRVVLVIESYDSLRSLEELLENILKQNFKVDLIILIEKNSRPVANIRIVKDTCVINRVGRLSIPFKQGSRNTLLLFLFPLCFSRFKDPALLSEIVLRQKKCPDIVPIDCDTLNINIDEVYRDLSI